jgi:hypothetical protein
MTIFLALAISQRELILYYKFSKKKKKEEKPSNLNTEYKEFNLDVRKGSCRCKSPFSEGRLSLKYSLNFDAY